MAVYNALMKFARPIALAVILMILTAGLAWRYRQSSQDHHVHIHAGFQVYVDGQKQDYSDFKYMHVRPCGGDDHANLSAAEEQQEKAHLHDSVGDVVHVHAAGATWGDLFQNLGVQFPDSSEVVGYTPERVDSILTKNIVANESIVIVVGDQSTASAVLDQRVTLDHIKEVESMSENCGAE